MVFDWIFPCFRRPLRRYQDAFTKKILDEYREKLKKVKFLD